VYFTAPQDDNDLAKSFDIGEAICAAINEKYGAPIELEMEKVYKPMLYVAKKCYAAMMFESPTDQGKLDVKGMAMVKGDSSGLIRKLQLGVIQAVMQNPRNAWPAVKQLVQTAIDEIKSADKSTLVKRVKLNSGYKNPDGLIQVQVAKRMKLRGQQEPQPGELVPYIVAKGPAKNISARADHPNHVLDIDYNYYINRQIMLPLERILAVVNKDYNKDF